MYISVCHVSVCVYNFTYNIIYGNIFLLADVIIHGKWSMWGECSKTCGDSEKARWRSGVLSDTEYMERNKHLIFQVKDCDKDACAGLFAFHHTLIVVDVYFIEINILSYIIIISIALLYVTCDD